jgi:hypothetical protein
MALSSSVTRAAAVALGAIALALVPTGTASAATCSLAGGKDRKLGPTYTTKLTVTKTSCASGEKLVRAYYKCRVAAGGKKGTCRRRVSGFTCSEKRTNAIATQFNALVTCRKSGGVRVVHKYTQFLS